MSDAKIDIYKQNRMLRREAGEEWHAEGLIQPLMGAILIRESLLDEIHDKQLGADEMRHDMQYQQYLELGIKINRLKELYNATDMPPLRSEE